MANEQLELMAQQLGLPEAPDGALRITYGDDAPIEVQLADLDGDMHSNLLKELKSRKNFSSEYTSDRHEDWDRVREHKNMYVNLTRNARAGDRSSMGEIEMPFERSIVIPLSKATLEVLITQIMSIYASRTPMNQIQAMAGGDPVRAKIIESMISYDNGQSRAFSAIYAMFSDALSFGNGFMYNSWEIDEGMTYEFEPLNIGGVPPELQRAVLGPLAYTPIRKIGVQREYCKWTPISAYDAIPDPRVSMWDLQSGEFFGHRWKSSPHSLKKKEGERGPYFNVDKIPKTSRQDDTHKLRSSSPDPYNAASEADPKELLSTKNPSFVNMYTMVWELIPSDHGLGESDFPEKWVFSWAEDKVIVRAHPMVNKHQRFPYSCAEPEPNFFDTFSPGTLELIEPLQRFINWLYNCYSEDTDVLTSDGWVNIANVTEETKVATVDPGTRGLHFEAPKQLFEYQGPDRMVQFKNQQIDCLVTPNHKMVVEIDGKLERVEAADLVGKTSLMVRGGLEWNCADASPLILDEVVPIRDRGNPQRHSHAEISPEVLASMVGWFVSEGSVSRNVMQLVQRADRHAKEIDVVIEGIDLHCTRSEKDGVVRWVITDKRLASWLRDNCYVSDVYNSTGKMIPQSMKEWKPELLSHIFEAAMLGDGSYSKDRPNLGSYSTCSRQLADDMQELALKLGYAANIVDAGLTSSGKKHWRVNLNKDGARVTVRPEHTSLEKYDGKVYCFENSTHITVVRRGGKPIVSGQSHIENITRVLNNQWVYSPEFIDEGDLEFGGPGEHIRMTQEAVDMMLNGEIQDIRQFLFQMPVQDVTGASYMNAIQYTYQMAQVLTGANDPLSGIQLPTQRSATEVGTITAQATQRMAITARLMDENAIQELMSQSIHNRQQFTSIARYYEIAGRLAQELGIDSIFGDLEAIQGDFKYKAISGILPEDPARSAASWTNLMAAAGQLPQLQQPGPDGRMLDFRSIFNTIAEKSGISNIEDYYMDVQVMPDEQMAAELQAGNLAPVGG